MTDLVTTNIRIPEKEFSKYKELAQKQGKSFAALVRSALQATYKSHKAKNNKKKSLWDIDKNSVKIKNLGSKESIDEVVYGNPHGEKQ